jgi:protoheme IX farnesyltransferase
MGFYSMYSYLSSYFTVSKWRDLLVLGKARLSFSVVFSAGAGYLIATEAFQLTQFLYLIAGGIAITMAANAFNQIIEKDIDAKMSRTANRPLPAGRLSVSESFMTAAILTLIGAILLIKVNALTAAFGFISLIVYVLLYTPLKAITPFSVFVGAIPGAMPFMLGWVGATGRFGIEPGTLFAAQFLWQFAHFWAIAWILFEDYKKVNYHLLPTDRPNEKASFQIVLYSAASVVTALLPAFGITGSLHLSLWSALLVLLIGLYFVRSALILHKNPSVFHARLVMRTSIIYLTLIQMIYVLDKFSFQ